MFFSQVPVNFVQVGRAGCSGVAWTGVAALVAAPFPLEFVLGVLKLQVPSLVGDDSAWANRNQNGTNCPAWHPEHALPFPALRAAAQGRRALGSLGRRLSARLKYLQIDFQ